MGRSANSENDPFREAVHRAYEAVDADDLPSLITSLEQTDHQTHYAGVMLTYAAGRGRTALVRSLLERGTNPGTYESGYGWSALMNASRAGHLEIVRILLEAGANVNYCETRDFGLTALDAAEQGGHNAIRTLLLQVGAKHLRE
jgi:ankyrin repeat protein